VQEQVQIEVEVGQQVDLVHQHHLTGAEHQGVLERLVLALGDRSDHHAGVLADLELGRAHEVADVLDHEQVDLVQWQRRDRGPHHVRVEVAFATETGVRVDLGHRYMEARQPVGIEVALHVALQHAYSDIVEVVQHALEQSRLARAGCAHHVHHPHARAVEVGAIGLRDRGVGVERFLGDPDLRLVQVPPPPTSCGLSGTAGSPAIEQQPRRPSRRSRRGTGPLTCS
jgi:hypothetical protein